MNNWDFIIHTFAYLAGSTEKSFYRDSPSVPNNPFQPICWYIYIYIHIIIIILYIYICTLILYIYTLYYYILYANIPTANSFKPCCQTHQVPDPGCCCGYWKHPANERSLLKGHCRGCDLAPMSQMSQSYPVMLCQWAMKNRKMLMGWMGCKKGKLWISIWSCTRFRDWSEIEKDSMWEEL